VARKTKPVLTDKSIEMLQQLQGDGPDILPTPVIVERALDLLLFVTTARSKKPTRGEWIGTVHDEDPTPAPVYKERPE